MKFIRALLAKLAGNNVDSVVSTLATAQRKLLALEVSKATEADALYEAADAAQEESIRAARVATKLGSLLS